MEWNSFVYDTAHKKYDIANLLLFFPAIFIKLFINSELSGKHTKNIIFLKKQCILNRFYTSILSLFRHVDPSWINHSYRQLGLVAYTAKLVGCKRNS